MTARSLSAVVDALERIAPLSGASSWDNVGLLVEPMLDASAGRILLCIDLTEAVLDEAIAQRAELIVAYHPPLFGGVKRLTQSSALQRSLLRSVSAGIAIYSPHTALDAAVGGVCDWLGEGLGELSASVPIECGAEDPTVGAGRLATLTTPASLPSLVRDLKTHLGITHLRVARHERHAGEHATIRAVALCPGAGGGLFERVETADLFLTGEMRHHDVLARVAQGAAVILTDHSHSERGYLPVLRDRLEGLLDGAAHVMISSADTEPLEVL
jgi:dinuclear metal center YbgI/SA1388 family protein